MVENAPGLRAWFEQAVELPPGEREPALRAAGVDSDALAEVLALCAASDRAATQRFAQPREAMLQSLSAPTLAIGDVLGPWRIAGDIGRGGMGWVHRVERTDGHYTQTAALKFIAGMPTAQHLAFFTRERQLLAQLSHPNIARLLDGGASDDGRPYLVMEYIDGAHIDVWCKERGFGTRDIAKLFLQACDAVAFAHRQLIVHCDIKPSNLLVDGNGRVVLLDFGVARLHGRHNEAPHARGYTPGYASPEQLAGEPVSTETDVYSLGVVLLELLAAAPGKPAYELGAIATKASAPDPRMRYSTAEALGLDLQRFLERRAVVAMGASRWYRAQCFMRRHTTALLLAAGLVVALVGGLVATTIGLDQAQRERLRAERTALFLGDVLSAVDPDRARDLDKQLLREILDRAATKAQTELKDEPLVLADIERVIGNTYAQLSELEAAIRHLSHALDVLPANAMRERLKLRARIADMKDGLNRPVEALADLEAVARESESAFGALDPDTLERRQALVDQIARSGDARRALALAEPLQPLLEAHLGRDDAATLGNLHTIAIATGDVGDFERAERTYLDLIARLKALRGEAHSRTISAQSSLAVLYLVHKHYGKAKALLQPLYPIVEQRFGAHSIQAVNVASMTGSALRLGGEVAASQPWYLRALEDGRAVYGAGNSATLRLEVNYANLEVDLGQAQAALARLERIGAATREHRGPRSLGVRNWHTSRARALTALGRIDEARNAWTEALSIDRELYGDDSHPNVVEDLDALAALAPLVRP